MVFRLKTLVLQYMLLLLRFFTFYVFFENPKNATLRFFALLHTFSRTMSTGQTPFPSPIQKCQRKRNTALKSMGKWVNVLAYAVKTNNEAIISYCSALSQSPAKLQDYRHRASKSHGVSVY